jgi:hypothetical protein
MSSVVQAFQPALQVGDDGLISPVGGRSYASIALSAAMQPISLCRTGPQSCPSASLRVRRLRDLPLPLDVEVKYARLAAEILDRR